MRQVRIVTDSAAEVDPALAEELGIVVVPLQVCLGDRNVTETAEMRASAFHEQNARDRIALQVTCPPSRAFREVYAQLSREADDIVSVHVSTLPCNTYRPALDAAGMILGRARIEVIDSTFMSHAMGAIVVEAGRAARDGAEGAEVVRLVRGMVAHTYLAFFVDSLGYLRRSGALRYSDRPLPAASNARPLFVMEDGIVAPQFRLRAKGSAVERLVDFVAEFLALQQLVIVHSGLMLELQELKGLLQERLGLDGLQEHIYGASVAALVGPRALGVVAIEGAS